MDLRRHDEALTFTAERQSDESGVSGLGVVLDGIIFPGGKTVIKWRGELSSTAIYDSFIDFKTIHVDSHPSNGTILRFSDGRVYRQDIDEWE